MANEVTIVIRGRNESGPAFRQPGEDVEKLGEKARKTSEDVDGLGTKTRKTSRDTDELGDKVSAADRALLSLMADFNRTGDGASRFGRSLTDDGDMARFLEERLQRLGVEARRLAEEFTRTGNIDVYKKFKENQGDRSAFGSISKDLRATLEDGVSSAGPGIGAKLSQAIGRGVSSSPVGVAIAALIVAASPLIAGAISAAVLAGAAGTGIGLGIAGSLQDSRTKDAFKQAGRGLMGELTTDTASFTEPLIASIGTVSGALKDAIGSIDFGKAGEYLTQLSDAVASALERLGPSIGNALDKAGPVVDALAESIGLIADAVGQALDEISDHGGDAASALRAITMLVVGLVVAFGGLVSGLSTVWGGLTAFADGIAGVVEALTRGIPVVGDIATKVRELDDWLRAGSDSNVTYMKALGDVGAQAQLTQEDLDALAGKLGETANTTDTLAASMVDKLFSSMMTLDQSTLSWHESLTRLGEGMKQHGNSVDENTAKGQANIEMIYGAVSANQRQYQANIAAGMSAQEAAHAYDDNTAALERQLRKAGLTQQEIDGLIGKYRSVPDRVNTEIATRGLTDAINDLADLIREINGLPRYTRLTVEENRRITYSGGSASEYYRGLASGGIIGAAGGGPRSNWTWVGEQGRELVRLPFGSTVYPHGQSEQMGGRMAAQPAGGYAPSREVVFSGDVDSAFATAFMRMVRTGQIQLN